MRDEICECCGHDVDVVYDDVPYGSTYVTRIAGGDCTNLRCDGYVKQCRRCETVVEFLNPHEYECLCFGLQETARGDLRPLRPLLAF